MTSPALSIIVLTYKREVLLRKTLVSILTAVENIDAEVIVVNDDKEKLPDLQGLDKNTKLKLVQNPGKGVAQARNFGAETALAPTLIYIDDDFLVSDEAISGLMGLVDEHPERAFNALWEYPPALMEKIRKTKFGRYLISEGYTSIKDRLSKDFRWEDNALFEREKGLCSGLFAISKKNFDRSGGHNEKMPFGTDTDFSHRLRDIGIKVYIASYIKAYHNEEDKTDDFALWLKRRMAGLSSALKHKSIPRFAYSPLKKPVLKAILKNRPMLIAAEKSFPNIPALDPIYRRLVNAIFAASIFEIYYYQED